MLQREVVAAGKHTHFGAPGHEVAVPGRLRNAAQPLDRQAAEDFNKVYVALVETVANRPTRPAWNEDSFFRRFAK